MESDRGTLAYCVAELKSARGNQNGSHIAPCVRHFFSLALGKDFSDYEADTILEEYKNQSIETSSIILQIRKMNSDQILDYLQKNVENISPFQFSIISAVM